MIPDAPGTACDPEHLLHVRSRPGCSEMTVCIRFASVYERHLSEPRRAEPGKGCSDRDRPAWKCPRWSERPLLLKRMDGTVQLIGTTADLGPLVRWILSFGPGATVESPVRLQRWIRRLLTRAAASYLRADGRARLPAP